MRSMWQRLIWFKYYFKFLIKSIENVAWLTYAKSERRFLKPDRTIQKCCEMDANTFFRITQNNRNERNHNATTKERISFIFNRCLVREANIQCRYELTKSSFQTTFKYSLGMPSITFTGALTLFLSRAHAHSQFLCLSHVGAQLQYI